MKADHVDVAKMKDILSALRGLSSDVAELDNKISGYPGAQLNDASSDLAHAVVSVGRAIDNAEAQLSSHE